MPETGLHSVLDCCLEAVVGQYWTGGLAALCPFLFRRLSIRRLSRRIGLVCTTKEPIAYPAPFSHPPFSSSCLVRLSLFTATHPDWENSPPVPAAARVWPMDVFIILFSCCYVLHASSLFRVIGLTETLHRPRVMLLSYMANMVPVKCQGRYDHTVCDVSS